MQAARLARLAASRRPEELWRRFLALHGFARPAVTRTAFDAAVRLGAVADFADRLAAEAKGRLDDPLALDAILRGLMRAGRRAEALRLARAADGPGAQGWRARLEGMMPTPDDRAPQKPPHEAAPKAPPR